MVNHRPLQKQYKQKATVKHHIIPDVIAVPSVDITTINRNDKDKFGNIVYKGSGSGGGAKRTPLIQISEKRPGYFKRGSRRAKPAKHPQSVNYTHFKSEYYSASQQYAYCRGTVIKRKMRYTGKLIRHLINE